MNSPTRISPSRLKLSKKLKEVYGEDYNNNVEDNVFDASPEGINTVSVASFELDFNIDEEKAPEFLPIKHSILTADDECTVASKSNPKSTPALTPKLTTKMTRRSIPNDNPRIRTQTAKRMAGLKTSSKKKTLGGGDTSLSVLSSPVMPIQNLSDRKHEDLQEALSMSISSPEKMEIESNIKVESEVKTAPADLSVSKSTAQYPPMKLKTINECLLEIGDLKIALAGLQSNISECKRSMWEAGLVVADCVELNVNSKINDQTLETYSLCQVAAQLRGLINQLSPWKIRLMTTLNKQLKDFHDKRKEYIGKETHMGQIARRLTDDKDAIHSELIELRTSTNMKIHQLERELETVSIRNISLEEENEVLKAKCDKLYDEHLSIPRLEEKMHRETKETLFSMNVMMRQKEKHWSKAEIAAKESGYWQQKVKGLELQLFEANNALKAEKRESGVSKRDFERIIENLKRERTKLMGNTMTMPLRRSSTELSGGRRGSCYADSSQGRHSDFQDPSHHEEDQQNQQDQAPDPTNNSFLMKMTEDMMGKLRSDVQKKDVIIQRLSVQLAKARGRPLSQMQKEGFDSMGKDLDDLKRREMYGKQAMENAKVMETHVHHKSNAYNTVGELLDSYYAERHVEDDFIEDDSHNSDEERAFEALKNEKKKKFEREAKEHLGNKREDIEKELELSSKAQQHNSGNSRRPLSAPSVIREVRESGNFEPKRVKKLTLVGGLRERSARHGFTPAQRLQLEKEEKRRLRVNSSDED